VRDMLLEELFEADWELEAIAELFDEEEKVSDLYNELLDHNAAFEDELEQADEIIDTVVPKLKLTPQTGHFYQIKLGDTLFGITSRAYGVKPGTERLKLARLINNDLY
jgi:LysM repeat protein